jgi:hypothetical protein
MSNNKRKKASSNAKQAFVHKEMAKPRITKSANSGTEPRCLPNPRTTKYELAWHRHQNQTVSAPEPSRKGTDRYRRCRPGISRLRIENSLVDKHGDEVSLNKGAHVEVIVTGKLKAFGHHD